MSKVLCFTVESVVPAGPPPENDNTIEGSTIQGAGARNLGDPATGRRAKHGTFGTTLASFPGERRGVFAQRTTQSGIYATDGRRGGNLRRIRRGRFANS